MLRSIVSNNYIERLEFLSDEIEIDVSRSWCNSVMSYLNSEQDYGDLLNMVSWLLSPQKQHATSSFQVSRTVKMLVGDVKKLVSICENSTFCCIFPYNYDELASKFLEDKLGTIKIEIELLVADNKIDDVFKLIDNIENGYIRRLSLLYIKSIYNDKTEKMLDEIRLSRKKTINEINNKLC